MRVLLRVLAPLLGLGLAAAGALLVIEVVTAWVRTPATAGLIVPWPAWQAGLEDLTWRDGVVRWIAVGVAVVGLVLLAVGLSARQRVVRFAEPSPGITVTTSPRVLARLVGQTARAGQGVAGASVSASARAVSVRAEGWSGEGVAAVRDVVRTDVGTLLDELPLARRPRLAVSVHERGGPR